MKSKFLLPIIFTYIVCLCFFFSACSKSNNFDFAENSTVNLKYTCVDEEKNFDIALNAEQSSKFVLSLNKISYDVVKTREINFSTPYDSLMIEINHESLVLDDVAYIINYGGYFYFNDKLCKSEEKFGFLESFLVVYCPDIIPKSVPFGIQYVKSSIGAEENYQIIKSVSELNDYILTETQNIDLPHIVLFKDEVVDKYDEEYFENAFIIIFMKAASSGSYGFKVNNVYISRDRLFIDYEIIWPSDVGVTCDMAYWYSFVELKNEYNAIKNVDLISVKEIIR